MRASVCPDENALGAFVDGRLDDDARAAVEHHLDACAACREAASALTAIRSGAPDARPPLAASSDDPEVPADTRIGRFVVMGVIARGGMGVVYRAHDPALDRDVALKLLRADRIGGAAADGAGAGARLEREAKAIARVRHANVIAVHDVGTFEDRVFLAMELIEGETLASFLARANRGASAIVAAFREAGLGLAAAHDAGLVHRDFKPDNVLVGREGRVVVTDFGLACAVGRAEPAAPPGERPPLAAGTLTRTGALLGTPAYMAPEQHRGEAVSAQSDQFSFCVALWEALSGELPFRTLDDRLAGRVAALPANARMPARVRRALLRGLRAAPGERHASMRALLRELSPPRSRVVGPALLALGVAAIAAGMAFGAARRSGVCASSKTALAGVWDGERKRAVSAALLVTGKPYAADAVNEVDRALDAYAGSWSAMRLDACEATSVRHEQSEDLLDRRMRCLDARRAELGALVSALEHGGDAVDRAASAAHGLSSIAWCADASALLARVGPPKETGARAEADAIDSDLGTVRANLDLGRAGVAAGLVDAAVERARKLGYAPSLARALFLSGYVHSGGADPRAGEASLREAARVADGAGDDETRARAWLELTRILGQQDERSGAALEAAEEGRAAITRLGGSDELEAKRLDGLGIVLYLAGRSAEAVDAMRRSLALRERVFGPDSREVGELLDHLGSVLVGTGPAANQEALTMARRALAIDEKVLGPRHPTSGKRRYGVARVLLLLGDFAESAVESRRAIAIFEEAQRIEHPNMAYTLGLLGAALAGLGQHERAIVEYRRSVSLLERTVGPKHREIAETLCIMGSSLTKLHRHDEAEDAIARGLAMMEQLLPPSHPLLATPLRTMGELRIEQRRPGEAVAPLERALALVAGGAPEARGEVRFQLARALLGAKKQAEAKAMADAAQADLEAAGEAGAAMRKELAAFRQREGLP